MFCGASRPRLVRRSKEQLAACAPDSIGRDAIMMDGTSES